MEVSTAVETLQKQASLFSSNNTNGETHDSQIFLGNKDIAKSDGQMAEEDALLKQLEEAIDDTEPCKITDDIIKASKCLDELNGEDDLAMEVAGSVTSEGDLSFMTIDELGSERSGDSPVPENGISESDKNDLDFATPTSSPSNFKDLDKSVENDQSDCFANDCDETVLEKVATKTDPETVSIDSNKELSCIENGAEKTGEVEKNEEAINDQFEKDLLEIIDLEEEDDQRPATSENPEASKGLDKPEGTEKLLTEEAGKEEIENLTETVSSPVPVQDDERKEGEVSSTKEYPEVMEVDEETTSVAQPELKEMEAGEGSAIVNLTEDEEMELFPETCKLNEGEPSSLSSKTKPEETVESMSEEPANLNEKKNDRVDDSDDIMCLGEIAAAPTEALDENKAPENQVSKSPKLSVECLSASSEIDEPEKMSIDEPEPAKLDESLAEKDAPPALPEPDPVRSLPSPKCQPVCNSTKGPEIDDSDDIVILDEETETPSTNESLKRKRETEHEEHEPAEKRRLSDSVAETDFGSTSDEPRIQSPSKQSIQDEKRVLANEKKLTNSTIEETEEKLEAKKTASQPVEYSDMTVEGALENSEPESSIKLNFLRKFKKSFDKMTRSDLEEFMLQKIAEVIVAKSEIADLRAKSEKQEQVILSFRNKTQDLSKQLRDLEMIHQRLMKDLEAQSDKHVTPIKITRAVGLQVSQPGKSVPDRVANQVAPFPNMPQLAQPSLQGQGRVLSHNTQFVQNRAPNTQMGRMVRQNSQHQMSRPLVMPGRMQTPPSISNPTPPPPSPLPRKKAMKYTPMRPPLSPAQQNALENQQTQEQKQRELLLAEQKKRNNLVRNSPPTALVTTQQVKQALQQVKLNPATSLIKLGANGQPRQTVNALAPQVPQVIPKPGVSKVVIRKNVTTGGPMVRSQPVLPQPSQASRTVIYGPPQSPSFTPKATSAVEIDLTDDDDLVHRQKQTISVRTPQALNQGLSKNIQIRQSSMTVSRTSIARPGPPQMTIKMSSVPASTGVPTRPKIGPKSVMQAANNEAMFPPPLPNSPAVPSRPGWKYPPPRPSVRINTVDTGIVISWNIVYNEFDPTKFAVIAKYQIYAYQETNAPPTTEMWRHVGDVKAMPLPMAVTLTQFQEGERYYFAVRAIDEHSRVGPFSTPKLWDEPK